MYGEGGVLISRDDHTYPIEQSPQPREGTKAVNSHHNMPQSHVHLSVDK